jgi:hypothetical protein
LPVITHLWAQLLYRAHLLKSIPKQAPLITCLISFFQKLNTPELIKIITYKGQAELDYTLWTRDSVLLLEAKQVKKGDPKYHLDIGWHKLPMLL